MVKCRMKEKQGIRTVACRPVDYSNLFCLLKDAFRPTESVDKPKAKTPSCAVVSNHPFATPHGDPGVEFYASLRSDAPICCREAKLAAASFKDLSKIDRPDRDGRQLLMRPAERDLQSARCILLGKFSVGSLGQFNYDHYDARSLVRERRSPRNLQCSSGCTSAKSA